MRKNALKILALFLLSISSNAQDGEQIFKSLCAVCHTTTDAKLIGPGLANIHEKRTIEWFKKFVASSQSFIESGDAEAIKIFEEYKMVMPDQALSEAEIEATYEYLKSVSPASTGEAEAEVEVSPFVVSAEDIIKGNLLFSGKLRFKNGGPSCISCHNVLDDNIISGGALAVDLSDAYERLGNTGIQAMIVGLPFPQMKTSYENQLIEEEESHQLTAYLKEVSKDRLNQSGTSYVGILLSGGIAGALLLMGIFPLIWYKRKKESVNKRIYERQIKSRN